MLIPVREQYINLLCLTRVRHDSSSTDKPVALEFPVELELEMLVFEEEGKPENPEKNPRSSGENQR